MRKTIALLITLDTKDQEAGFLKEQIEAIKEILKDPTREKSNPFVVSGCIKILNRQITKNEVHAVLGLGGTQGTSTCCEIMQALPYGFPKIMVSTIASGDMSGFVGIKDITMMFSVSDILKLNPFTRSGGGMWNGCSRD